MISGKYQRRSYSFECRWFQMLAVWLGVNNPKARAFMVQDLQITAKTWRKILSCMPLRLVQFASAAVKPSVKFREITFM